ncbi:PEGA domain-containing protein [Lujinxingia sediminis]|uniref:PEGA domain-containing protein n=1 Tax=Lujinxingia sediminis TaxID=2480984 RepID=A0ABY0CT19_9DELT|nr:PEGA domain-containing protein [Lujinxingia sediminis]RVU44750.1 PEGA domain-containing protein [Lujinxingia sediminis]
MLPSFRRLASEGSRLSLGALTMAAMSLSSPLLAHAQTPAPAPHQCPDYVSPDHREDARVLTLHGVSCFEAGDFERALHYYLRAYARSPGPLLRGAIGRSLHELGIYGPARQYYQDYLDSPAADTSGAQRIRERIEQLDATLAEDAAALEVRSSPPGARAHLVFESGEWFELGTTPVTARVREGRYEVALTREGYRTQRVRTRVHSNTQAVVEPTLVADAAAFDVSAASWRRGALWTLVASTPVAAAGTAMLILSAQDSEAARNADTLYEDSDEAEQRRAVLLERSDNLRTWGTAATVAGAAGMITGVVLYFSANRLASPGGEPGAESQAGVRVQPELGANYAGVRVRF